MNKVKFSLLFFVVTLFFACKTAPEFDLQLLYGEWTGADWLISGKSSGRAAEEVRFSFTATEYTAAYGEQRERGSWRVEGKKLYTVADNKIEKVVKVSRISSDTLVLDMNRAGQDEQLILVKK